MIRWNTVLCCCSLLIIGLSLSNAQQEVAGKGAQLPYPGLVRGCKSSILTESTKPNFVKSLSPRILQLASSPYLLKGRFNA
jgi:hypothetical protein